jgi:hypothetical protein
MDYLCAFILNNSTNMEIMTADAHYENAWHRFLSALEQQPCLRLAPFLRSLHVYHRGFEKWMYKHGYSVGEAKERVLQLRKGVQFPSEADSPSFLPVSVGAPSVCPADDFLSGISLTLPDGTVISIRRGSASAVVAFLKLYTKEEMPCLD